MDGQYPEMQLVGLVQLVLVHDRPPLQLVKMETGQVTEQALVVSVIVRWMVMMKEVVHVVVLH